MKYVTISQCRSVGDYCAELHETGKGMAVDMIGWYSTRADALMASMAEWPDALGEGAALELQLLASLDAVGVRIPPPPTVPRLPKKFYMRARQ
jgi:hypothetical protein